MHMMPPMAFQPRMIPRAGLPLQRSFHASARRLVKVGDRIPGAPALLMENSPGNKVDLAKEVGTGKALIVGVPAAFSPSCSESHIPGYLRHPALAHAGPAFVVAMNDAFVMAAWQRQLDPTGGSGLRFLADPSGAFTRALDLAFDGASIFGGDRAKRFALLVENGVVTKHFVEPDNTGLDVSRAEKVLG